MGFEAKKFETIYKEMAGRPTGVTDFEVGSVARTMYESFSYELALLYEKMYRVYLSAYVGSAEGHQLDQVVEILGIKRSLPDYAEGEVAFQRDVGKEDIQIPLGTLVATEDTPDNPKKVYKTIELKILPQAQTGIDVKVQAVERGEQHIAPAETILIMPRPVPGIKSVVNREAVTFLGKRRETDEELRERAKNTLISSGKASIVAIENALLALSGVKDVRVRENFHYARGQVSMEGPEGLLIPQGAVLVAQLSNDDEMRFKTMRKTMLTGTVELIDIRAIKEGKNGEVTDSTLISTWRFANDEFAGVELEKVNTPILLEDFGIIDVFVDGPDLADEEKTEALWNEIDRVRSAGIMVLLKPVTQVEVDGIFQIIINPGLNLSPTEKEKIEIEVKTGIERFLLDLKMGKPLQFTKLIQHVLSFDGVDNLEDFRISTTKKGEEGPKDLSGKCIELEEQERFLPRSICVASEEKSLPVNIEFSVIGLDEGQKNAILDALVLYFQNLARGKTLSKTEILTGIDEPPGFRLKPESWCSRVDLVTDEGDFVNTGFVERPLLGDILAYDSYLDIIAGIKAVFPENTSDDIKESIRTEQLLPKFEEYFYLRKSAESIHFSGLVDLSNQVKGVLVAECIPEHFVVEKDGVILEERIDPEKGLIEVASSEKPRLLCLFLNEDYPEIQVSITEMTLAIEETEDFETDEDTLLTAVPPVIAAYIENLGPGQDVIYQSLKEEIEKAASEVDYTVATLSMTAVSVCDGRIQTTENLVARPVEEMVLSAIEDITVELKSV